ncbi:MAG: 6,7-dimethyl-8-ribityllumazine synthase [Betaproteobacteria bacterium AqS2]|uniref:6,7-dimethyl-8-ribityllumazine synthase n=1 Tax=Candidatus Amphirhobacter heronislandensis TaxID=1732024 RepID=A0A930Y268_9GAMM|nr:6,7-dimethyl-8-ribityllumazine synthase [Betaproteobacteria bacterium AqS2]
MIEGKENYRIIKGHKGLSLNVAVARSEFNKEVVDVLCDGFYAELEKRAAADKNHPTVHVFEVCVPGALEIPYALSRIAKTEFKNDSRPGVLAGLGCVIKGETFHFDIVSQTSAAGIQKVSLKTKLPAVNGILTCYTAYQARERAQRNAAGYAEAVLWMGTMFRNGGPEKLF